MADFNVRIVDSKGSVQDVPPPTVASFKVTVENPIAAKVNLKARKTLDGNILIVDHPEIDIVAIMSPSGMHYEHALKILNKFRKHLIIEKPTTLRTSNLKKIFITAEKLKRKIYPIFQNRNNKCVMKLKEEINKGKLGESYNISGEKELSNLDLAKFISKVSGYKLNYKMVYKKMRF